MVEGDHLKGKFLFLATNVRSERVPKRSSSQEATLHRHHSRLAPNGLCASLCAATAAAAMVCRQVSERRRCAGAGSWPATQCSSQSQLGVFALLRRREPRPTSRPLRSHLPPPGAWSGIWRSVGSSQPHCPVAPGAIYTWHRLLKMLHKVRGASPNPIQLLQRLSMRYTLCQKDFTRRRVVTTLPPHARRMSFQKASGYVSIA